MRNKATHYGICQCCGAYQKLPNGKLSKHGYTIDRGYFSGICRGTNELPYEQSFDLIAKFVLGAKAELARVWEQINQLRTTTNGPKAWANNYIKGQAIGGWYRQSHYEWMEVEVKQETIKIRDDYSFTRISYENGNGGWCGNMSGISDLKSVSEACTKMNGQYADYLERHDVASLNRYIAWQQSRIDNWKLLPLKQVEGEKNLTGKGGFDPEANS